MTFKELKGKAKKLGLTLKSCSGETGEKLYLYDGDTCTHETWGDDNNLYYFLEGYEAAMGKRNM